jgi:phage shock protein PspC (stress-responsive transcriptional regulator)
LETLALTPFLLLLEPVRTIVSIEATIAALASGVVAGITVSLALDHFQIRSQNDVLTTIVTLVAVGITTVLLWLLVPTELIGTVHQFALAFIWSLSLTSVARHVVWPKATDSMNIQD